VESIPLQTNDSRVSDSSSHDPSYELTWPQRLNYSWAEMGLQLTLGGILKQLFFCTDIVGLQPARAGTAVLLGRVWDAFNDPLVGQLSDKTRSKAGRRRSWMGAGIVPMGITYFLLWCVSPNWSMNFAFWFMVLMPMLHNTFQTMVATPYASMSAEITLNYHERTILSGIRTFIHSVFFGFAFALGPVVAEKYFSSQRVGYVTLGAVFAAVVIGGGLVTYLKTEDPNFILPFQKIWSHINEVILVMFRVKFPRSVINPPTIDEQAIKTIRSNNDFCLPNLREPEGLSRDDSIIVFSVISLSLPDPFRINSHDSIFLVSEISHMERAATAVGHVASIICLLFRPFNS